MLSKRDSLILGAVIYCVVCIILLCISVSQVDAKSNIIEELLSPVIHLLFSVGILLLLIKESNHE